MKESKNTSKIDKVVTLVTRVGIKFCQCPDPLVKKNICRILYYEDVYK